MLITTSPHLGILATEPGYAIASFLTPRRADAELFFLYTKLGRLHEKGLLTAEEFAQVKARLIIET